MLEFYLKDRVLDHEDSFTGFLRGNSILIHTVQIEVDQFLLI